ncbi:MAG: hypothetical protein ACMG57_02700 [Candidatus Dojkabacteria bacterium]
MKKGILIGLGLLLVCCCCSVVVGSILLFTSASGYVEFNGRCVHKGLNANPTTGPCATMMGDLDPKTTTVPPMMGTTPTPVPQPQTSGTKTYTGKNVADYSFTYSDKFFLDDSGAIVYVYKKDPKLNVSGDFNDNLNITSADTALVVTQTSCTSYANDLIASIGSSLNVDESSLETKVDTINGLKVCGVRWNASINGTDFKQEQYVFSDTKNDKNYILTVSLADSSTNGSLFADIVNSFETK